MRYVVLLIVLVAAHLVTAVSVRVSAMSQSISLDLARDQISEQYEKSITSVARSQNLDPKKDRLLTPWVQSIVRNLRTATSGPLKTDTVTREVNGKVRRALTSISKDQRTISYKEASSIYVSELRDRVLSLFVPKFSDIAALEAAIKASSIPEMNDYNKGFGFNTYGAGADIKHIGADVSGNEYVTLQKDMKGVEEFVSFVRDRAEQELKDAEDQTLGQQLNKLHNDVADAVQALFGNKDAFTTFYYHYNGIVEDGATEYAVLAGKRVDGSWVAVMYSNFPF